MKKQRPYQIYQQREYNIKDPLYQIEKFSSLTHQIRESNIVNPRPKAKLIRRQVCPLEFKQKNLLKTQQTRNEDVSNTPKYMKTQKSQEQAHLRYKTFKVNSFKMDQSFSQKVKTVKKEERDYDSKRPIQLELENIYLKNNKRQNMIQKQDFKKAEESQLAGSLHKVVLQDGWVYRGECSAGLFHGIGQLFYQQKLVYSGQFSCGYFNGYGKLIFHEYFEYLVKFDENLRSIVPHDREQPNDWLYFVGEFRKGNIHGFGQLWVQQDRRIISKWQKGMVNLSCCVVAVDQVN